MRTMLFHDAVTILWPSGLNTAELTLDVCPLSIPIHSPVSVTQIRAVLSLDEVTIL